MGQTVLATKDDRGPFGERELGERVHEIVPQSRIDHPRVGLGFQLSFVNSDQFFAFARVLTEEVVGNAKEPGRELRFASEAPDVFVGADERFLRQIVGQFDVAPSELAQETAHGRLMPADQLAKSVLVAVNKDAREQVRIGQLHITL